MTTNSLLILKDNPQLFLKLSLDVQNDEQIVCSLINERINVFPYCNEIIRYKREVAIKAIRFKHDNMEHINPNLKDDESFLIEAITNKFKNQIYLAGKTTLITKMHHFPMNLNTNYSIEDPIEHVYDQIKFDQYGDYINSNEEVSILSYMSERLKNSKFFALSVIEENHSGEDIRFFSESIKNDDEVVISLINKNSMKVKYLSDKVKKNKKYAEIAIEQNSNSFKYFDKEVKNDELIIFQAIKANGQNLEHLSLENRGNKKYVLEAVKQNVQNYLYADKKLAHVLEKEEDKVAALEKMILKEKLETTIMDTNQNSYKVKI